MTRAVVPAGLLAGGSSALAWREQGSVLAEDWLGYALAAAVLLATILASGIAVRPANALLTGLAALAALALWTAVSGIWSPVPALARDEGLLVLFYGVALAIPLLTLRSESERVVVVGVVVSAAGLLVVATCVRLLLDDDPADLYWAGRLASPVGYPGAGAAIFLVSFWPATALAASRRLPVVVRAFAVGASVALLAGWLMSQSRAGAVSLAVSAVVVFVLAPTRMRLLVPVALAAGLVGASYHPLTEPFRSDGAAFDEAIQDAGRWTLLLSIAGVGLGLAYAFGDRHLVVPPRVERIAGSAAVIALMLGALGGMVGYFAAVDKPVGEIQDRWQTFKHRPAEETGSSHLATLGTNRYDLWRVALNEFRDHPVAGAGGRAFGPAYQIQGRTGETPRRAHSLELDVLSETGLVGFALLVAALLPFVWAAVVRARGGLVATGVVGGIAYWLVHATGDWIWTFPAAALPFFVLLGVGAAGGSARLLARAGLPAGVMLAAASLLLFAPPWLSSRYTARALEQSPPAAKDDLRWARRLDPLSIDPLIAEAKLARSPAEAIEPLREAVEQEPRSLGPRYLLGIAYLEAGRPLDARRELREALRLGPRSVAVQDALRRAQATRFRVAAP